MSRDHDARRRDHARDYDRRSDHDDDHRRDYDRDRDYDRGRRDYDDRGRRDYDNRGRKYDDGRGYGRSRNYVDRDDHGRDNDDRSRDGGRGRDDRGRGRSPSGAARRSRSASPPRPRERSCFSAAPPGGALLGLPGAGPSTGFSAAAAAGMRMPGIVLTPELQALQHRVSNPNPNPNPSPNPNQEVKECHPSPRPNQEVKECAISCVGLVLSHLGDACAAEAPWLGLGLRRRPEP